MNYTVPLKEGHLIRRYKRFLADVEVDGEQITVHCPNSGSMAGLLEEGNPVRISGPHGGKRKLPYTLEQIRITRRDERKLWVGVNTSLPNRIVQEMAEAGRLPGFEQAVKVNTEVRLGDHSRIDLTLELATGELAWVEVKNCTMVQVDVTDRNSVNEGTIATFPDAVTSRGLKHLELLMERVRHGEPAAVVFTVQRSDADAFAPAIAYDGVYAARFRDAFDAGVNLLPMVAEVDRKGVRLTGEVLPVIG